MYQALPVPGAGDRIEKAQHLPSQNILSQFHTGMPSTSEVQPHHSILHSKERNRALEQGYVGLGSHRGQASDVASVPDSGPRGDFRS